MIHVLILDSDRAFAKTLERVLLRQTEPAFYVVTAQSTSEARQHVQRSGTFDIFLISQELQSNVDGIVALQLLHLLSSHTAAVVLFARYDAEAARSAFRMGGHYYLPKDINRSALIWILRSLYARGALQASGRDWISTLVDAADKNQHTFSVSEVADAIVYGGLQVGFERARLWLYEESRKVLIGRAQAQNKGLAKFIDSEMPLDESYYGRHMPEQTEPRIFHGRDRGSSFLDSRFEDFKAPQGDWAIVPLYLGDTFLGVLSLDDQDLIRTLDDTQLQLLGRFGRLAVLALQRAREDYERDWLSKLTKMVDQAQQKHSVVEVGDVIVQCAQQLGFERARLWQYYDEERKLIGLSERGNQNIADFAGFGIAIEESVFSRNIPEKHDPQFYPGRRHEQNRKDRPGLLDTGFPHWDPPAGEWVIIPLRSGSDKCLGMLALDNNDRSLTSEQKALLSHLSSPIVAVLEGIHARYGLEKLSRMAEDALKTLSVKDVLEVIMRSGLALGFERARLWRYAKDEEDGKEFLVGFKEEPRQGLEDFHTVLVPFEKSSYLKTLNLDERKPQYFPARDKADAVLDIQRPGFEPPAGEWVEIPLWSKNRPFVMLTLDNDRHKWSIHPYKRELLKLFVWQASAVLERAASVEEHERLITARNITQAISETLNLDDTIRDVLEALHKLFDDASLFILLYNGTDALDSTEASFDYYHPDDNESGRLTSIPIGDHRVLGKDASMVGQLAADALKDPKVDIYYLPNVKDPNKKYPYLELIKTTQSEISMTLMMDNRLLGVLTIEHRNFYAFTDEDANLLRIIRPTISSAIDRAVRSQRAYDLLNWITDTKKRLIDLIRNDSTDISKERIGEELDEVILWLFWDLAEERLDLREHKLVLQDPLFVQQRNSMVVAVWADKMSRYYIKLGSIKRIQDEQLNYQVYIHGKDKVTPGFYATHERSKILGNIGGVVYSFGSGVNVIDFHEYFRDYHAQHIVRSLESLFNSWRSHYEQATRSLNRPGDATKIQSEEANDVQSTKRIGKQKLPSLFQAYEAVWETGWRSRMRRIVANAAAPWPSQQRISNPIQWLLRNVGLDSAGDTNYSEDPYIMFAVTHGDLNGDDLFVDTDTGRIYISNYKRSGPGHILQDFLELEVNLLVRFIRALSEDGSSFKRLVVHVLSISPEAAKRPENLDAVSADPQTIKTLEIIYGLRRLMYEHTYRHINNRDSYATQILWGLLFNAANLATLLHERGAKREHCARALLLASLVCQRIESPDDIRVDDIHTPDSKNQAIEIALKRQQMLDDLAHANDLLEKLKRRLRLLELGEAYGGVDTRPQVLMEITDLKGNITEQERRIAELKRQLGEK